MARANVTAFGYVLGKVVDVSMLFRPDEFEVAVKHDPFTLVPAPGSKMQFDHNELGRMSGRITSIRYGEHVEQTRLITYGIEDAKVTEV